MDPGDCAPNNLSLSAGNRIGLASNIWGRNLALGMQFEVFWLATVGVN